MTHEEKINYFRIALGLQNIGVTNELADRIVETYEKILKLEGKFSVEDAVHIELSMDRKYAKEKLKSKKEINYGKFCRNTQTIHT